MQFKASALILAFAGAAATAGVTNPFNEGQRVLTKGATPGVVLIHAPSAKRTVEAHIV